MFKEVIGLPMTHRACRDESAPRISARRWGTGADFGPIAVYLASGATGYTTGRDFVIDGGYTLF